MLQCLAPEERLALILGDIMEVSGAEGAQMLGVSPAAYRKRLSRARQSLVAFVSGQCGIVNPASPCRCSRLADAKRQGGQLDPERLSYPGPLGAAAERELEQAGRAGDEMIRRTTALMRAHPTYTSQSDLAARIEHVVRTVLPPLQSAG
jgi:Sigma-70, region 4